MSPNSGSAERSGESGIQGPSERGRGTQREQERQSDEVGIGSRQTEEGLGLGDSSYLWAGLADLSPSPSLLNSLMTASVSGLGQPIRTTTQRLSRPHLCTLPPSPAPGLAPKPLSSALPLGWSPPLGSPSVPMPT